MTRLSIALIPSVGAASPAFAHLDPPESGSVAGNILSHRGRAAARIAGGLLLVAGA